MKHVMACTIVLLFCITALLWCTPDRPLSASGAEEFGTAPADAERARHFDAQIAPLLARRCLECHDSAVKEGGLDLSRRDGTLAGGDTGPAIVPGDADDSLLWQYVEFDLMPPDDRPPLSDEEKQLLQQWIDDGAVWSADTIDASALTRDDRAAYRWLQRLTVPEYIETVRSAVGVDIEHEARRLLPADMRADGFSNTAYNLNVDLEHVEAYAQLAEIIVGRMDVEAFAAQYADCQELDDACMREVIAEMGKWLLRGPLEEHEVNAFLSVANAVGEEGGDFTEAVSFVIEAMLQSPRFVFRIETQRGDGVIRPVGPYELASRMSYIIWGGPPDKELMRAAEAGELADPGHIAAQVERMLEDPRTLDRSMQFIYEWLDLDRLSNLRPNPDRFPQWDAQLAADMRDETLAFFHHIVWEEKRPLWDLMNAQVTFATPRLADFYGFEQNDSAAPQYRALARPQRVTEGLQALYTFEEGSGEVVRDVSEAGEPLDLNIAHPSAVDWSDDGLAVRSSTLIAGEFPAHRLIDAVRSSGEITLEAWVTPENTSQDGPARIVTLSNSISSRNFTLGQSGNRFETRLRTTSTSENGLPELSSSSDTAGTRRVHVVYTRDSSGQAVVYINGRQSESREIGGDFANWDHGFQIALGNELTEERPWLGTMHLVAVYDQSLSAEQVSQNFAAGSRQDAPPALQALYRFSEGSGSTVRDTSGAGQPLDLTIEDTSAVEWRDGGLSVHSSTLIGSDGPPARLIDAILDTGEITIEAWVTPENTSQDGPARIVTLSSGTSQRNFTLGQDGDKYDARFRTSTRDANGMPGLSTPSGSVETRPAHVVYTRSSTGTGVLYVNGEEKDGHFVDGNLSNWDHGFRLMLANESTEDRPWLGTYHSIAIYNRALTPEEVRSKGAGLSRYDLASVPARGGLLSQASVLTVGGDEASMVARGLFILHDVLHSAVGNAPPGVDTSPVPTEPGMSQRAISEARLSDSSCVGCHSRFEPLAFGLEKFDGIGAYFDTDPHGNELRDDGEILFPGEAEPVAYDTSAELMDLLAESDRVRMNFTRKVTQFALGRPLVESDAPVLQQIHATAKEGGGTYPSLVKALILSDLVRMTRTESDVAAYQLDQQPQRVTNNLQALFTFQERSGDVVRDVSDAGSPLDLKVADSSAVRWGDDGLAVNSSTRIASENPPARLIEAIEKSQAITLEAWITPENTSQDGPARIVTLSDGTTQRNFTMGQEGDRYDVRLRTSGTNPNGMPGLDSSSGSVATQLTHVVYTRDEGGAAKLYVDGQQQDAREVGGELSNWDDGFHLALANESTNDRPWKGTLHLIAIYDRALSADEVRQHHDAGPR